MTDTLTPDAYLDLLRSKVSFDRTDGFDVEPGDINPILKPHQADIVRWAVQGGQRAIFASFGLELADAPRQRTRPTDLRILRQTVQASRLPNHAGPRAVLLVGLRESPSPDLDLLLRPLRCTVHPASFRDGCRASVLLAWVLPGVAGDEPESGHLPEGRSGPSASARSSEGARQGTPTRRGCASHRRGQAQLRDSEPRSVPRSVASRSVPSGRHVR